MKTSTKRASFAVFAVLVLTFAQASFGQSVGQSKTLLPDGSVLLLGGFDSHNAPTGSATIIPGVGLPHKLTAQLNVARAGHSATVLPDGTVFIFGGAGADGKVVKNAELFDPSTQQFEILTDVIAIPRSFHTATLLTDGTLLLAGGVMAGGQFPGDVQLMDWRTRRALSFEALLSTPREGHTATLQQDGSVRISGGTDRFGRPVPTDEIFDPVSKRFRIASASDTAENAQQLTIAASMPEDGAENVSVQTLIAIRFSGLLNVTTVVPNNFQLTGPDQRVIEAKVTAAESGRLVFVVPSAPLQPGTTYVLTMKGATDTQGNVLPDTLIDFTTEGAPPEGNGPDWVPNPTWTDPGGTTKFQDLPPLQAHAGTTALAGQVLKLSGWPLGHVTLEINGKKVRTDATGRFLLTGLSAGRNVLWIDGTTANTNDASYGVYEVGVTILPNKTNVVNYTIWMTRLDMAHAVTIPSPTASETVITNPSLPGLELHLPAGTVITDRYGKVTRQISITPVPLNKPPFPLPSGVQVPIYFTIQPGGAYVNVKSAANGAQGARLFYPNSFHLPPGRSFDFWNYDADVKGWYVYGAGTVSPDGGQVVPNPGVYIYEFTGAMVEGPGGAPQQGCRPGIISCYWADPVSVTSGSFTYNKVDLALPDILSIEVNRTYVSNDSHVRSFGIGASLSYDMYMVGDTNPYTYQELVLPDGGRIRFDRISAGTSYGDAVYVSTTAQTRFYGATLSSNGNSILGGPWIMRLKDGTQYAFPDSSGVTSPYCATVEGIMDRFGNRITLTRTPVNPQQPTSTWCLLTKITGPGGRSISFTRDNQQRITQAQDSAGRTVTYAYDSAGRLASVTDVGGGVTTFMYDDFNDMLTVTDPRNIVYVTNEYDAAGRVIKQTEADGGTWQFSWTPSQFTEAYSYVGFGTATGGGDFLLSGCWNGIAYNRYASTCGAGYLPQIQYVDITDPRGYVEHIVFNNNGYIATDSHAVGQPEQQTLTYTYYNDNTMQSVTDTLGRVTSFDYDAQGNPTRVTQLDGTSNAITTTFTYEPYFDQLASITDPLGHSSTFSYDALGNLVTATDPLNHHTTFAHNGFGQLTSVTDALSNQVRFGYFGGDLVSVTDPLGNVSTSNYDTAGRLIAAIDAQGNTASYQYNVFNLTTQVTDAKGGNTSFTYDGNGNLLSLTDALNHTTSWTYNNMDRPATRTDPLNRHESYLYDLNGNLASTTDRKGQVTSVTYDALNRTTMVGYNTQVNGGNTTYESTISYTYDAGSRMTQAVDTAGGTITEAYDNLDRLTTETTAQGSMSYGYDNAGRRTTMQVASQPQLSYTYDNANRLTQMTQGSSSVGFSYDNVNRRSALTLPNGVSVSYTYDSDSRIAGITYQFGSNTLGNLSYSYDSLGRRTQVGGSFASTGLPGAIAAATYDAANELTNWNGTAISYDLDGNMLSDGTNAFTWNARNQVATLNSVSPQYDAFGRRMRNAAGTSFLYDGPNAAQELSGTTPTANLWTGAVDEVFQRSDSNGPVTPLTDALGSVIALVDANGRVVTQYSYDPFGNTTTTGAESSNPSQYTGRENEGNGLYFYRARYYSPVLHRFVSQDPLGFSGSGPNFYVYAADSPTNFRDPFGLQSVTTGPVTTPYQATPTAGQVTQAIESVETATQAAEAGEATVAVTTAGEGTAPVMTLIAEGSAGGSEAGPIGVLAGIGLAALGGIIKSEVQATAAVMGENDAYAQEMQSIALYNQEMMRHPPLAGRACKKRSDHGDDCDERHAKEEAFCRQEYGGYPNLLGGCLNRAFWRWSNCKKGVPDPGPLDPMDPNWRWD